MIDKIGKQKLDRQRYYLHSCIKKQGFKVSSSLKTVYVPFNVESLSKQMIRLRDEFNYSIQTEI